MTAAAVDVATADVSDLIVFVDFNQSLEAMIAAGHYDWRESAISSSHFPIEVRGLKRFRAKLFHFNRYTSSEDAVVAIEKEGYAPATHVHGLAFGAAYPDLQRKFPIACLGSLTQVCGGRFVVCLDGFVALERELDLIKWDGGWGDFWRFLGVQEVSDR